MNQNLLDYLEFGLWDKLQCCKYVCGTNGYSNSNSIIYWVSDNSWVNSEKASKNRSFGNYKLSIKITVPWLYILILLQFTAIGSTMDTAWVSGSSDNPPTVSTHPSHVRYHIKQCKYPVCTMERIFKSMLRTPNVA